MILKFLFTVFSLDFQGGVSSASNVELRNPIYLRIAVPKPSLLKQAASILFVRHFGESTIDERTPPDHAFRATARNDETRSHAAAVAYWQSLIQASPVATPSHGYSARTIQEALAEDDIIAERALDSTHPDVRVRQ